MSDVKESEAFSQRLLVALCNAGIRPTPTRVAQLFNKASKKWSVTPHAVRKWIKGETIPNQDRLCVLADLLGVAPDWLRFGEKSVTQEPPVVNNINVLQMTALYRQFGEKQQRQIIELLRLLTSFGCESAESEPAETC